VIPCATLLSVAVLSPFWYLFPVWSSFIPGYVLPPAQRPILHINDINDYDRTALSVTSVLNSLFSPWATEPCQDIMLTSLLTLTVMMPEQSSLHD